MSFAPSAEKHGDLIYDVGMHKGEDTDFFLKKGFRVVAFEADPELVELNRSRFSESLRQSRLVIVAGAVVDNPASGRAVFYKNASNTEWGTVDSAWAARNETLGTRNVIIEVDAVNFSACLARYGIPHYMKIDIEGADLICLKHLARLDGRPDFLSIESDKTSVEHVAEEISLLEGLGYDRFKAMQQEYIHLQRVPHPAREGRYVLHRFPDCSSGLFGAELPGRWKSREQILRQYRRIFMEYRWFGDATFWQHDRTANRILRKISMLLGRPIPGWYDTHARLSLSRWDTHEVPREYGG